MILNWDCLSKLSRSGPGTALLLLMSFAGLIAAHGKEDPVRPNILVIMSDDQGCGDIGYNNPLVNSPALDQLAGEAAVFTNFVSCPACTPARASYLTGRNFLSTGVWGVGPRGYINRDEIYLPEYLRRAGYRTAHFGKWGEGWTPDQRPYMRGYDTAAAMATYQHKDPWMDHDGKLVQDKGWTVDVLADLTIEFIRRQTEAKQPWYAITAYISPHAPWECDPNYSEPLEAKGYSKALAALYGMVAQMDEATGRILAGIEKLGIADRTIVIFLSDNGASPNSDRGGGPGLETPVGSEDWNRRNPLHLRGEKALVWENGIRVPFIVRWPGHIPPGMRPQAASIEDVLPTVLDLAGVSSTVVPGQLPLDGRSFKDVLLHPDAPANDRLIFTLPVAYEGAPPSWPKLIIEEPEKLKYEQVHAVVRGTRYKYHSLPGGRSALFDIQMDPGETTDVSKENPEIAGKMAGACREAWDELIKSGRCFRMPVFLVGDSRFEGMSRCWAFLPPSIVPGNSARKVTGTVTCPFEGAKGFTAAGDSASYAVDVRKAGRYRIAVKGGNLDKCAPLGITIAGRRLPPEKTAPGDAEFGEIDLPEGPAEVVIEATGKGGWPAVVQELSIKPAETSEGENKP